MPDITPWLQFGFPAALTVLIVVGLGLGAKWFLQKYLEQQAAEFEARQAERERREGIIDEQQKFIKGLAEQSMQEQQKNIATHIKTSQALDNIVLSLQRISGDIVTHRTDFQSYVARETQVLGQLSDEHTVMIDSITNLQRAALTKHRGE